jgi:hypothetical protein
VAALWAGRAYAEDFYVAPDGDDGHAGTIDAPFATVEKGEDAASPGDTVYIRDGEYKFSGTDRTVGVAFTKSGTQGKPIHYFAYPGETPIFDLFEVMPQARVTGLDVHTNYIHVRGLEVRGVRQLIVGDSWSVRIRGDHNIIERLNVHDGEAPGIFITSGASNLILNCDSHHNYDPLEDGGNADGFGCHSSGGDNVLRGCRAYENSDDGFDFINASGTCTVEDSWSFRNGFIPDTDTKIGNGAGFKSGGYGIPPNPPKAVPRHVVRRNLAFANLIGFYANYHTGGLDFFNNTAFDNPANYDMRPAPNVPTMHKLRNNIAAGTGQKIVNFTGGGNDDFNSWTLPVDVSIDDFTSMDKPIGTMPRDADGNLPTTLMRLVQGSDLIDRGEDVGLPFVGNAPDLGAYEFGAKETGGASDGGVADAAVDHDSGVMMMTGSGGAPAMPSGSGGAPGAGAPSGSGGATAPAGGGGASAAMGSGGSSSAPPAAMGMSGTSGEGDQTGGGASSGCGCRASAAERPMPRSLVLLVALWLVTRRGKRTHLVEARARRRQVARPP